jgi:hypothetical protein
MGTILILGGVALLAFFALGSSGKTTAPIKKTAPANVNPLATDAELVTSCPEGQYWIGNACHSKDELLNEGTANDLAANAAACNGDPTCLAALDVGGIVRGSIIAGNDERAFYKNRVLRARITSDAIVGG